MSARPSQNVFIAAISSDIGGALAHMYLEEGCNVVGTYRDDSGLESLKGQPGVIEAMQRRLDLAPQSLMKVRRSRVESEQKRILASAIPFRPALSACVSKLKCRSQYVR
jgi:NADP-dependent 3-hydroxy acid dehydrogenase YdfG